jgi:hypothetical protein
MEPLEFMERLAASMTQSRKMSAPAERMEIPSNSDLMTYANVDLTETIKLFEQYGI